MYALFFKRLIDFLAALTGLVLLSPLLLLVATPLYFANDEKVFFVQKRPGKNGKIFKLVKFKTMNDKKDSEGNLLPDMERLTSIGSFLRNTSIDEIPQLWNVLTGDMSLIGPRPLLVEYLPLYSRFQKRRHEVRPGITGWAQVNGRNSLTWKEKFKLDIWYVDHLSFLLDVKILWKTFLKTFKQEGINSDETTTMKAFNGRN